MPTRNEQTPPADAGPVFSEGLGLGPERAARERARMELWALIDQYALLPDATADETFKSARNDLAALIDRLIPASIDSRVNGESSKERQALEAFLSACMDGGMDGSAMTAAMLERVRPQEARLRVEIERLRAAPVMQRPDGQRGTNVSTFSSNIGPEEEDGAGWESSLVPTKAERDEEKQRERVRQQINALQANERRLIDELWQAKKDTERLAYLYSGQQTGSNALVNAEMRLLNGEALTLEDARAAIDEAMRTPPAPVVGAA